MSMIPFVMVLVLSPLVGSVLKLLQQRIIPAAFVSRMQECENEAYLKNCPLSMVGAFKTSLAITFPG